MKNELYYSRRDRLIVDTAHLLYDGKLDEMKRDITNHFGNNYGRIGFRKREMFVEDIKRLEMLILQQYII